jgi:hypothetical protein
MRIGCFTGIAFAVVALASTIPDEPGAQTTHAAAKARVEAHDAKTHNKLKTEGIPTVTGAVAGGVAGGPPGALAGAKMGHAAGVGIHAVKKHHDIEKAEKHGARPRHVVRRTRAAHARTTARGRWTLH